MFLSTYIHYFSSCSMVFPFSSQHITQVLVGMHIREVRKDKEKGEQKNPFATFFFLFHAKFR